MVQWSWIVLELVPDFNSVVRLIQDSEIRLVGAAIEDRNETIQRNQYEAFHLRKRRVQLDIRKFSFPTQRSLSLP